MPVAPLLAPGGVEMRVVSQAAAFTWGSWSVSWPEGFEPPDPPAEDRELGWVADLGGTEVEPFGRCFVRADAQIDATLGRSNVEDVLDAAKYRTSGEVFLETEIPFENLAGQLPYRDFDVNSLVPTRVGGRILENQLVTKVEESEDEQGNRTATTYIGGQKFQDREALRTRNREIDRVIAQERLERGDEIGAKLAASQEYEREQRDNLKRYVDRRDDEVTTSAEEDASAKAGAALSTARTDAQGYADTAQSQAESYARQQDVLKLKEAKQHAEDEDKKLKRGVDLIIGPEGSLTRQVRELNDDYTAKLGENGSVIEDQAAHQRMLSGIVYGKPVSELEGTAFQAQQQAVNEMNDVFRNKQTTINKGFDYLFGLNEKINLAQDYNIEFNRIMAESRQAHDFEIQVWMRGNRIVRQQTMWDRSGATVGVSKVENAFVWVGLQDGANAYGFLRATRWGMNDRRFYAHSATNGREMEFYFGWPAFPSGEEIWVILNGTLFPQQTFPKYQQQLADLQAEYRAKGLRV